MNIWTQYISVLYTIIKDNTATFSLDSFTQQWLNVYRLHAHFYNIKEISANGISQTGHNSTMIKMSNVSKKYTIIASDFLANVSV